MRRVGGRAAGGRVAGGRAAGGRAAGGRVVGGWSLGWWVVFGRLGGLWPGGRGASLWLVSPDRWVGACGPSQADCRPPATFT